MIIVLIVDLLIIAFFLAADLITKHYAEKLLADGGSYEAIKNVLSFQYTENDGAAFGMLSNARVLLCVFVGIVVLGMLGFLAWHIYKRKYKEKGGILLHVALSLIISGGIGNLVDRIALGYVRDFIDYTVLYTLFKIDFAICNVADVVLTIGIILLVIYLIVFMVDDFKKAKKERIAESVNEITGSDAENSAPLTKEDPSANEIEEPTVDMPDGDDGDKE